MKTETFHLELITPCFCGGAEPEKQAEIRAPSIRGQLRWWFRTLGGFRSLAPMPVRDQEAMIFGSTAGNEGKAGKLIVRVTAEKPTLLRSTVTKDDKAMNATVGTERGYLLFPLRPTKKEPNKARGVFAEQLPHFELSVLRRGKLAPWETEQDFVADVTSLVSVFGHLGALGFRSRRAMGALAFRRAAPDLPAALNRFAKPQAVSIKQMQAKNAEEAIVILARWLKKWRANGRAGKNTEEQEQMGFRFAKNDHDRGVDVGTGRGSQSDLTYRPALGLPIIQFFSSGKPQVDWNESYDPTKVRQRRDYRGEGRFASPVLLRPHRDAQGHWHALVIFVDAHKWPAGKQVYLNGQPRNVSLELYEAMKNAHRLQPFP